MDLLKTKIYLEKLQREYNRLSKDPENIARIDIDIMASYVRELYDALLSEETGVAAPKPEPAPRKTVAARPIAVEPPPPVIPVAPPPPPIPAPAAPPPPVYEKPVYEEPVYIAEPEPPVQAEPPAPAKPHHHTHHHAHHGEAEILFEEKQAKELSEKLAEQPIADLKKAIALNDRLLLTRELFAGDGKAFEATLQALNGFSHFDAAKGYLIDHCVSRYHWLDKKRIDEAKKFIKLVRRRYK